MKKGLRLHSPSTMSSQLLCRNDDLMKKGLRLIFFSIAVLATSRNDDLMKKGLRLQMLSLSL